MPLYPSLLTLIPLSGQHKLYIFLFFFLWKISGDVRVVEGRVAGYCWFRLAHRGRVNKVERLVFILQTRDALLRSGGLDKRGLTLLSTSSLLCISFPFFSLFDWHQSWYRQRIDTSCSALYLSTGTVRRFIVLLTTTSRSLLQSTLANVAHSLSSSSVVVFFFLLTQT